MKQHLYKIDGVKLTLYETVTLSARPWRGFARYYGCGYCV